MSGQAQDGRVCKGNEYVSDRRGGGFIHLNSSAALDSNSYKKRQCEFSFLGKIFPIKKGFKIIRITPERSIF